jgi:16S rRNA C1402 (ribose-2'-O) methylase RsmI
MRSWFAFLDVVIHVNAGDGFISFHFVGLEGVGALLEHFGDIVAHDAMCLDIQVSHHGIMVPSAHHAYVIHVNLAHSIVIAPPAQRDLALISDAGMPM